MFGLFKPRRSFRLITADRAGELLTRAFPHGLNCHVRLADRLYSLTTRDEVARIARKAWEPWVAETDDCDDQALAVKHHANREAWQLGLKQPLAIGVMWSAGSQSHAYVPAIVERGSHDQEVAFYDQTTGFWVPFAALDLPITLLFM